MVSRTNLLGVWVLPGIVAIGLAACGGNNTTNPNGPTPRTLSTVAISGSTSFSAPGETAQLAAIANYSNGTSENVTATAAWQTANPDVAVVSGAGQLTARGPGATEVTATYQGITGRVGVNVSGPACSFSLSETAVTFERDGGSRSVSVSASASSCRWEASSNAGWLRITSGTSGTGSGTVAYQVDPHTGTTAREGVITIGGQTLTVRQTSDSGGSAGCRPVGPSDPFQYCVDPGSRTVSSTGGTFTVGVVSNGSWTATSNQGWVRVVSGSRGDGNATVTYVVDANPFTTVRVAMIAVEGLSRTNPPAIHTVTQLGR